MRTWTKELGWGIAILVLVFFSAVGILTLVAGLLSTASIPSMVFLAGMVASLLWFLLEWVKIVMAALRQADHDVWQMLTNPGGSGLSWRDWWRSYHNVAYAWLAAAASMLGFILTEFVFAKGK